jgi:hypothetical protein
MLNVKRLYLFNLNVLYMCLVCFIYFSCISFSSAMHINLFVLAHIETHKPNDLFKEVTMKIVLNSNQMEVYRNNYE